MLLLFSHPSECNRPDKRKLSPENYFWFYCPKYAKIENQDSSIAPKRNFKSEDKERTPAMSEKNTSVIIRTARPEDASALLDIYAPYVVNTAISFEYEVPSIEEFQARMKNILQKYPWLVAEKDGELLGYAYTHAFVGRAAYDHSAETTIYLKQNRTKIGIGKRLYLTLEEISNAQNIYSLNACIGYPETEDEHLTMNSIRFHEHMGYRFVGKFHKCGYKFGTWYDMAWMEKILKEPPKTPPAVIPFPELG